MVWFGFLIAGGLRGSCLHDVAAEESAVLVLLVARAGGVEIPLFVGGAASGIGVSGVGAAC